MRRVLVAAMLMACGESTGLPGVLDRMYCYNPVYAFTVGQTYTFASYWRALDGGGHEMPLADIGLHYTLGDTTTAHAIPADDGFVLAERFRGYVYVFGQTDRGLERLGQHYIGVLP